MLGLWNIYINFYEFFCIILYWTVIKNTFRKIKCTNQEHIQNQQTVGSVISDLQHKLVCLAALVLWYQLCVVPLYVHLPKTSGSPDDLLIIIITSAVSITSALPLETDIYQNVPGRARPYSSSVSLRMMIRFNQTEYKLTLISSVAKPAELKQLTVIDMLEPSPQSAHMALHPSTVGGVRVIKIPFSCTTEAHYT